MRRVEYAHPSDSLPEDSVTTASASLTVNPRSVSLWSWHAGDPTVFQLRQVSTPLSVWTGFEPTASNVTSGTKIGGASMDPDQTYGLIRPDPNKSEPVTDGYTAREVLSGPNTGLWYVESASFESRRWWSINTHYVSSASSVWQTQSCGTANWYDLNVCADLTFSPADTTFPSTVATLYQGIADHEGYGNGGQGHQTFVEQVATQTNIDPYVGVEDAVAGNQGALETLVENKVNLRNDAWEDHWKNLGGTPNRTTEPAPGSNWGPLVFWFPDTSSNTLVQISLPGGE